MKTYRHSDLVKLLTAEPPVAGLSATTGAPGVACGLLREMAGRQDVAVVRCAATPPADDVSLSIQYPTVSVWLRAEEEPIRESAADPSEVADYPDDYYTNGPLDEIYVCVENGYLGGPVIHSVDGNSWVPAEHIDGVHRLGVPSGELVDPEVLL
jgi:hypothetical protein